MRAAAIFGAIIALASIAHATPATKPTKPTTTTTTAAVHEPCALVIVVDRARTMRGAKLAAVKDAVVELLATLDPSDQLAVVGFGRDARVIVPLQPVGKRKQIAAQVARLRAGAGGDSSDVVAGLDAAAAVLEGSALRRRRVVVITDSDALLGVGRAAGALHGDGIPVSAVGLQSLNHAALDAIAAAGGGQSHRVEDLAALPSILEIETTLPSPLDPSAVVLVIDRSGARDDAQLERTKAIARTVVEVLAPNDLIAVVAFDDGAQLVVPLQRAANRMAVSAEIARIAPGVGPANVYVGLTAAAEALAGVKAIKHVIVVSDGNAPSDGIAERVDDMRALGITTSAVGLPGADRNLLSMIAEVGDGRLYLADDLAALPRLFLRGTQPPPPRRVRR